MAAQPSYGVWSILPKLPLFGPVPQPAEVPPGGRAQGHPRSPRGKEPAHCVCAAERRRSPIVHVVPSCPQGARPATPHVPARGVPRESRVTNDHPIACRPVASGGSASGAWTPLTLRIAC